MGLILLIIRFDTLADIKNEESYKSLQLMTNVSPEFISDFDFYFEKGTQSQAYI